MLPLSESRLFGVSVNADLSFIYTSAKHVVPAIVPKEVSIHFNVCDSYICVLILIILYV